MHLAVVSLASIDVADQGQRELTHQFAQATTARSQCATKVDTLWMPKENGMGLPVMYAVRGAVRGAVG